MHLQDQKVQTPNPWVIRPFLANKNESIKMINLQPTLLECGEDSNNWKYSLHLNLAHMNPKDLLCQHS
jgi:hypothetical protein